MVGFPREYFALFVCKPSMDEFIHSLGFSYHLYVMFPNLHVYPDLQLFVSVHLNIVHLEVSPASLIHVTKFHHHSFKPALPCMCITSVKGLLSTWLPKPEAWASALTLPIFYSKHLISQQVLLTLPPEYSLASSLCQVTIISSFCCLSYSL